MTQWEKYKESLGEGNQGNISTHANFPFIESMTPLQQKIFPILNEYSDFFYAKRTPQNAKEIREMLMLHAVNHVIK